MHLPVINSNTLDLYKQLVTAALNFCRDHQQNIKPYLSGDHLIPEVLHPDASAFINRNSRKQ